MPFDPTTATQTCDACGREYPYDGGPEAICQACPGGGPDGDSHVPVSDNQRAIFRDRGDAAVAAVEPAPPPAAPTLIQRIAAGVTG